MSHTSTPPGSPSADDSGGFGQPNSEALKRGYEADGYHTLSVLSVPVLVVVFFVLAFGTTTVLFAFFSKSVIDPNAHPMASDRNKADLNERLKRINHGSEVDQPRLEPLRTRSGDNRAITRPEETNGENPPYLYPEDNRADATRTPELFRAGWADKDKKYAHVPLSSVLAGEVPALFPVQSHGSKALTSSHLPTAANAGRGAEHSTAEPPALPPADAKHPAGEHKDEPKKEQPKEAPKDTKGEKK